MTTCRLSLLDLTDLTLFERPAPGTQIRAPAAVTISSNRTLYVNRNARALLGDPTHVKFYFSASTRLVGLRACPGIDPDARALQAAGAISARVLIGELRVALGVHPAHLVGDCLLFSADRPAERP